MNLLKSNAYTRGKLKNGWFLGHFMEDKNLCDNDLEMQMIHLKKGFVKESTRINKKVKALTILIKGRFEISFPEENESFVLEKSGDFIKFDLSSRHIGRAIKSSTILTTKWPSKT